MLSSNSGKCLRDRSRDGACRALVKGAFRLGTVDAGFFAAATLRARFAGRAGFLARFRAVAAGRLARLELLARFACFGRPAARDRALLPRAFFAVAVRFRAAEPRLAARFFAITV